MAGRSLLCLLLLLGVASYAVAQSTQNALNPQQSPVANDVGGIDITATLATFKKNAKCRFPLMTVLDVSGSMTAVMSNTSKQEFANLKACAPTLSPDSITARYQSFAPGALKAAIEKNLVGTCPPGAADLFNAWKNGPTAEKQDAFLKAVLPSTYPIYRRRIDGLQQLASLLIQIMQFQRNGTLATFSSNSVEVLDAAVFDNLSPADVNKLVKAKVCPEKPFLKFGTVDMKLPICDGATNYAAGLYNATRWASTQSRDPNFAFGSIIFVTDGNPSSGLAGNTDPELQAKFDLLKNQSFHITTVTVVTPDAPQRTRLQGYASVNTDLNTAKQTPSFIEASNWDWNAVATQILKTTSKLCIPIYTYYFENDEASECDPLCSKRDTAGKCPAAITTCPAAPARFGGAGRSPYFNTNSPQGCAVNADSRCFRRADVIKRNLALVPDACGDAITKYVLCYASSVGTSNANKALSERRGTFMVKALTGAETAPKWVAVGGGEADNEPSNTARDVTKRFCAVSCGCVPKQYKKGAAASAPLCPE